MFCQSPTQLGESLRNLKTASDQNDTQSLESYWDDTLEAFADVRDSTEQMRDLKLNDLVLAWRNLEITVGAALGVSPPADAMVGIQQAWANVKEAFDQLVDENCGS